MKKKTWKEPVSYLYLDNNSAILNDSLHFLCAIWSNVHLCSQEVHFSLNMKFMMVNVSTVHWWRPECQTVHANCISNVIINMKDIFLLNNYKVEKNESGS